MVLTQVGFPMQEIRDRVSQGTNESFDKLDSLLASQVLV
jgi:hypothetical protein